MKVFLAAAMLFCSTHFAHASVRTTDQMACAAVVHQVKTQGRYYETVEGAPLPIYPVYAMPSAADWSTKCKARESLWQVIVPTRDVDQCLVGYQCIANM